MSKRFYQITVSERTADINIYGDINGSAEFINAVFDADVGGVSSKGVVKEIQDLDVDTINVYINSYGGEVAEALAIYSALKRHSASVHTYVDGFACSAATIIFCAGDVRTMGELALLMIHDCMSYSGYANSTQLRKLADDNDVINSRSIKAYMSVSNLQEDEITGMMAKETWLTAEQCLEYGFATEIADQDADGTPQQSAFGAIRNAVLFAQNIGEAVQRAIDKAIPDLQEALAQAVTSESDKDPDEDEKEDPEKDPDEDPDENDSDEEEDPDEDDKKEEQSAFNKFISFLA